MVPLKEVFTVEYGNKFDANKVSFVSSGVSFVSRSSKNLGVVGKVELIDDVEPFAAGLLTVTLGGTYLLSTFMQPEPFYTAQNIKILTPNEPMTAAEKMFYCVCIRANRFKYSTHGREANRSLDLILVPSRKELPEWIEEVNATKFAIRSDHLNGESKLAIPISDKLTRIDGLFDVTSGVLVPEKYRAKHRSSTDFLPYIRPSKTQTTCSVEFVDRTKVKDGFVFPRHTLYVSTNGQGSHTYSYVSIEEFVPNTDVSVLVPKRAMSLQEKLYYAAVITAHRPLFSYGRKPKGERLKGLLIPETAPVFVYEDDIASLLVV